MSSGSWRHLYNQLCAINEHHDKLNLGQLQRLAKITEALLPLDYKTVRQEIHDIRLDVDEDYRLANRKKSAELIAFKKAVSQQALPEAEVEILDGSVLSEQADKILSLTKQAAYWKSIAEQEKEKNYWLNMELSGLKQTTAMKQKVIEEKCGT